MQWWRGAVVYELDVRSFSDSDGIGDFDGLRARLGRPPCSCRSPRGDPAAAALAPGTAAWLA